MNEQLPKEDVTIPEVQLTPAQVERAYQLKKAWERPDPKLLVPLSLTRYIIHLRDENARLQSILDTLELGS